MSKHEAPKSSDLLPTLIEYVESYSNETDSSRRHSEQARDYYDGNQLTPKELQSLKDRGQPPTITNRIKRKVNSLKGIESSQRRDPKAFPRKPDTQDQAEAATDSIRFVVDNNKYDVIRSNQYENAIIEGTGGCQVFVDFRRDQFEIKIKRVAWDRLIYDPASTEKDFSDAGYKGVYIWMDLEDAVQKYGEEKRDVLSNSLSDETFDQTSEDKPRFWFDKKRKRLRVVNLDFKNKGKWWTATFVKGGFVEEPKESQYLDDKEEPVCSFHFYSVYIDRDNNRYGDVKDMIPIQDEINKRRSKSLVLLMNKAYMTQKGNISNIEDFKREAAKPDGVTEVNDLSRTIRVDNDVEVDRNAQFLQEAKNEIDLMGANPSLQGKTGGSLSGRALRQQEAAGMVELAPLQDARRQNDIDVYRAIWNRIRQYWTEEKWIRVTDVEGNAKFIGLNMPMTEGDVLEQSLKGKTAQERDEINQAVQESGIDLEAPTDKINNKVSDMDVDIIVDEGVDMVTQRAEEAEKIIQAVQAGVQMPPNVVLEGMDFRRSTLEAIKAATEGDEAAQAKAAQEAEEQQELQKQAIIAGVEQAMANVFKTQAETEKLKAETENVEAKTDNTDIDTQVKANSPLPE